MKRALVTGGSGFIGLALVRQLLDRGVEVKTLGRRPSDALAELGVEQVLGDLQDPAVVSQATAGCDTVFHVAAKAGIWGSFEEYHGINVVGSDNVIDACREHGVSRLVYTSTPSVVFNRRHIEGGDEGLPHAERFLCHYARTKSMAEKRLLAASSDRLKTVAIRPHLVWGPGDTNLIPRLLERGRRGLLKQVGDGSNLVDISYIDNVVDAHLLAADNLAGKATAAGRAYFISQGEPVNLWGWINELFARLAVPPVDNRVGFGVAYAAGALLEGIYTLAGRQDEPRMTRFLAEQLAKSHWFSIANARRDLGYEPKVSTAEGLDRLVASLRR